jgi:hypothetical protein
MSVIITVSIPAIPIAYAVLGGLLAAAANAAAANLGLKAGAGAGTGAKTVDLNVNNAGEVVPALSHGEKMTFHGDGVEVAFQLDHSGKPTVRVAGSGSEEELRALGEAMAKRVVQQFAYHRLVEEMRGRNMNIVEEEVDADGTVRMRVRVHQG